MAMLNGLEVSLILLLGIGGTAFWIWMLVDSGRRLRAGERQQLGWIIAIAITHILGALAYFIFGRRKNANQTTHA